MEIKRCGSQPSREDQRSISLERSESIRYSRPPIPRVLAVRASRFEPGARTAWHTHPLGQTLIVTSGVGLVQRWGGPVEEICFEPGEKHWHGARPTVAITHIAIQEALNGKVVDWMEQVIDSQYGKQL